MAITAHAPALPLQQPLTQHPILSTSSLPLSAQLLIAQAVVNSGTANWRSIQQAIEHSKEWPEHDAGKLTTQGYAEAWSRLMRERGLDPSACSQPLARPARKLVHSLYSALLLQLRQDILTNLSEEARLNSELTALRAAASGQSPTSSIPLPPPASKEERERAKQQQQHQRGHKDKDKEKESSHGPPSSSSTAATVTRGGTGAGSRRKSGRKGGATSSQNLRTASTSIAAAAESEDDSASLLSEALSTSVAGTPEVVGVVSPVAAIPPAESLKGQDPEAGKVDEVEGQGGGETEGEDTPALAVVEAEAEAEAEADVVQVEETPVPDSQPQKTGAQEKVEIKEMQVKSEEAEEEDVPMLEVGRSTSPAEALPAVTEAGEEAVGAKAEEEEVPQPGAVVEEEQEGAVEEVPEGEVRGKRTRKPTKKMKTAAATAAKRAQQAKKRKLSEPPSVSGSPAPEDSDATTTGGRKGRKRAKMGDEELSEEDQAARLAFTRRKSAFLRLLSQLQQERYSHFFESRVTRSIAPLYTTAVKRPSCLKDVIKKVKGGEVRDETELMREVALVCCNAMQFNGDEGPESVGYCAKLMWEKFESLMNEALSTEFAAGEMS